MVYAICKEGYPENPKKKVALVGPDRKEEVRHEKLDFDKKKVRSFHNFNIGRLLDTKIFSSLYDQGTPERSRGVQEAGNMFLAQIRVLRNEPPRP